MSDAMSTNANTNKTKAPDSLVLDAARRDLPACTTCGSLRGDPCRRPSGRTTAAHVARLELAEDQRRQRATDAAIARTPAAVIAADLADVAAEGRDLAFARAQTAPSDDDYLFSDVVDVLTRNPGASEAAVRSEIRARRRSSHSLDEAIRAGRVVRGPGGFRLYLAGAISSSGSVAGAISRGDLASGDPADPLGAVAGDVVEMLVAGIRDEIGHLDLIASFGLRRIAARELVEYIERRYIRLPPTMSTGSR
jgi:hypothetical protein